MKKEYLQNPMPKATKRAASRRAAKIAKAHATELAKLEVKEAPTRKRVPGYKPPARGLSRPVPDRRPDISAGAVGP